MKEFDWQKVWDANRNVGTLWGERLDTTREAIITTAKKYAAHVLREKAEAYMASGNVPYGFLGREMATRFRREADELDPQPEVIKLEKGKTYQLPDGSKVTT